MNHEGEANPNYKHGMSRTRAYMTWEAMKQRCHNPKHKKYQDYGGRGILVCERWQIFANFHTDMGCPPGKLTLERVDNDGGYSLENCKWVTRKEQKSNQRVRKDSKSARVFAPGSGDRIIVREGGVMSFCKAQGIHPGNFYQVLSGNQTQCRGWTGSYI